MSAFLIILIIAGVIALFILSPMFQAIVYVILALIIFAIFMRFFVRKYDENERAIIFRLGKFNRIGGPGWTIVIPFFEKEFSKVDVRTKMLTLYIPIAFTKDDLRLEISGLVYYQITNPEKAILSVESYMTGLNNVITSEARNAIAGMLMRELFANMDKLNDIVKNQIQHTIWKWGIDVNMVTIKGISPPSEIIEAMEGKEIAAQQLQSQRFMAEAQKAAIEAIGEAGKKLDNTSIMYLYIEALKEMSKGQATKIIFPMEFTSFLEGMKGGIDQKLAGMNVPLMINAIKDKIMESGKQ